MAFFKEFGKQVSDLAQTVSKRTGEAAELSRLNGRKQGVAQQIDSLYGQIGKAYFATREAAVHERADKLCAQVADLQADMVKLDRMIDRLRGQRRCPDCGELQASGARFCASCGARLPEEEREAEKAPPTPGEDAAPEPAPQEKGDVAVEITWPEAAQDEDREDV